MTDEQTKRIAQLRELIPQYKQHECSYDEHEAGCPVCNDIDCFENELTYLEGKPRRSTLESEV